MNAEAYPWSLVRGDLGENIRRLSLEECPPSDPIAAKVWQSAKLGYSVHALEVGLRMLGQSSWSTLVTEQGHQSASKLRKQHHMLGIGTLSARSLLLNVLLLFRITEQDKILAAAVAKIQRVARKQPHKLTGRHILTKELIDMATKR